MPDELFFFNVSKASLVLIFPFACILFWWRRSHMVAISNTIMETRLIDQKVEFLHAGVEAMDH